MFLLALLAANNFCAGKPLKHTAIKPMEKNAATVQPAVDSSINLSFIAQPSLFGANPEKPKLVTGPVLGAGRQITAFAA